MIFLGAIYGPHNIFIDNFSLLSLKLPIALQQVENSI